MTFATRAEAGFKLGVHLAGRGISPDLVLGLPRGGVVVAAEVARVLGRPLEVIVVRKVGHPRQSEFAVGALAEGGVLVLDAGARRELRFEHSELEGVIAAETERLRAYEAEFHLRGELNLTDKAVLIVDDGLATGATTEAAVKCARRKEARAILVAVPVASAHAAKRLRAVADEVIVLVEDPDFMAVGQYYDEFPQTTDREVVALLNMAQCGPGRCGCKAAD